MLKRDILFAFAQRGRRLRERVAIAVVIAGLAMAGNVMAQEESQRPVKEWMQHTGEGLFYDQGDYELRADLPRGWVSWQVAGGEFLHASDHVGGIVLRRGDQFVTEFTSASNLSHDTSFAWEGGVADGTYLLKMIPDRFSTDGTLYVGFNDERKHEVVIFLSDDVKLVRLGARGHRSWARRIATHDSAGPIDVSKKHHALLVHANGRAIRIDGPCRIGATEHPGGGERLALMFDAKGFAANEIEFTIEPAPRDENFALMPQFDVTQPRDGEIRGLGAAMGVDNPIYHPGDDADFNIVFNWLTDEPFKGFAEVEITHALGQRHFYQKVEPKRGEDGRWVAHFTPEFSMPGVSEVEGRLVGQHGRLIWTQRYRMGYDLDNYQPTYNAPDDLRAFWDRTLAEMRKLPLDAEIERVHPEFPDWQLYVVTYTILDGKRIHAMLYVPEGIDKPAPAIIASHPGTTGFKINRGPDGVYGSKFKHDPRFVTITPLIRGSEPDAEDIPFNKPWWGPIEDKETYVARYWYCAMVRAIDYLATRDDLVDMDRLVARGGSQGGALATVTAALDDRVDVALIDSPSNAMLHDAVQHYPTFGPTVGQVPEGQSLEQMLRTLSYFDPAHLAAWIECPAYVGFRIGDLTVHSMGGLGIYHNLVNVPDDQKGFYPGKDHFHANSHEGGAKFHQVINEIAGTDE